MNTHTALARFQPATSSPGAGTVDGGPTSCHVSGTRGRSGHSVVSGTLGASLVPGPALLGAAGVRPERRVLVLGHRGSLGPQRGENTVRAVEAALESGADGVEVDVRLTSDGVLVCSHDAVLHTVLGGSLQVASHTWDELRRAALRVGERLATLEEVLAAVGRRGPCHVVIEVKPAVDEAWAARTAAALVEALGGVSRAVSVSVTVSSFDWRLLGMVRSAVGGGVRTAVLGRAETSAHAVLRHALDAGHQEAHLSLAALRRTPHAVRLARQLGVAVTAWTVNGCDDLRRVAEWGVDAVITDNVVLAGTALRAASSVTSLKLAAC
jgi:glycerophosphoryl diester phosphodiesterase